MVSHLNSDYLYDILKPTILHGINIIYSELDHPRDYKIKYTNISPNNDLNSIVLDHIKESLLDSIAYMSSTHAAVRRTDSYLDILRTMLVNYNSVDYFDPVLYTDVAVTNLVTNKVLVYNLSGLNDVMLLINPASLTLVVNKCYTDSNAFYSDFEIEFPTSTADYVMGFPLYYPWEKEQS